MSIGQILLHIITAQTQQAREQALFILNQVRGEALIQLIYTSHTYHLYLLTNILEKIPWVLIVRPQKDGQLLLTADLWQMVRMIFKPTILLSQAELFDHPATLTTTENQLFKNQETQILLT